MTQWQNDDRHRIRPCGVTQNALTAGMYDLSGDMAGFYLKPKTVIHDPILTLPEASIDEILTRINKFWNSQHKYRSFGYIFKTGILIHGTPGTGKTMLVNRLAQQLVDLGGVVIYPDFDWLSSALQYIRAIEPDRHLIVVMEDIDDIIASDGEQAITALLDGENQINGVVYVATTNNIQALPPKIRYRPSRFDLVIEVPLPSAQSRLRYLEQNAGLHASPRDLSRWAAATEGFTVSHLKELIICIYCLDQEPTEVIRRLRAMTGSTVPVPAVTEEPELAGTVR